MKKSRRLNHRAGILLGLGGFLLVGSVLFASAGCAEKKLAGTLLREGREDLLVASCNLVLRCCNRGEIDVLLAPFVDQATCVERFQQTQFDPTVGDPWWSQISVVLLSDIRNALVNLPYYNWAVKAGRLTIDKDRMDDCLAYLHNLECPQYEEPEAECGQTEPERCPQPEAVEHHCFADEMFKGLVREGGACSKSIECADGHRCVHFSTPIATSQTEEPVPTDWPFAEQRGAQTIETREEGYCVRLSKEGQYCFVHEDCQEGLYCSFGGICTVPAKIGQPCAYLNPDEKYPNPADVSIRCEEDAFCNPFGADGPVCVAACDEGAACSFDIECKDGLFCVHPLYGDPRTTGGEEIGFLPYGRCRAPLPEGQWCGELEDCAANLFCQVPVWRLDAGPQAAKCSKKVDSGQFCYAAPADPLATEPFGRIPSHEACAGGFCQGIEVYGTTCAADGDCTPGKCDLTDPANPQCRPLCAAALANGQPCNLVGGNPQCVSGFCANTPNQATCSDRFPDGGSCTNDSECQSEHCVRDHCVTLPLAANQSCETSDQCATCFCSLDAAPICKPLPLGPNELCLTANECQPGYYCELNLATGQSRCAEALKEGNTCTTEAGGKPCGEDLYCDAQQQTPICRRLKPAGEACSEDRECLGECEPIYGQNRCTAQPASRTAVCDGK